MFGTGIAWAFLGCCCLASCSLTLLLICNHRSNYSQPVIQRKIVSIAWMVPVYSLESWLSLGFPRHAPFLDMVRDCYEAYVVYIFFSLCVAYIGRVDRENVDPSKVLLALQLERSISHPQPFNRCFNPINLVTSSNSFIVKCKFNILQFVVMKPLCTFAAWILALCGKYRDGDIDFSLGYVYLATVDNISVCFSLYYLTLFYMATKTALVPHSPLPKFLCIKFVIFFSWWQSVILAVLCWLGLLTEGVGPDQDPGVECQEVATSIQNVLVQVEMLLVAVAHLRVFSAAPFKFEGAREAPLRSMWVLLPFGRFGLRHDLREVAPAMMPVRSLRPPVEEHRLYMPPASDPCPLPSTPKGSSHVLMAEQADTGGSGGT